MDNAADRKLIRAKEKEAKLLARARAQVVRGLMATVDGREWVWHTLSQCNIFSSTFNGDALQTAFAEGQRSIGLSLLGEILTTCPEEFIQAQREANVRSTTTEQRSSTLADRGDTGPISDSRLGSEEGGTGEPEAGLGFAEHPIGFDADVRPNRFTRPYRLTGIDHD